MPEKPYRVVVWGPGGLGKVCIREIAERPEFELVGVLAYSEDKIGVDAGELAGIGPLGVTTTGDPAEILALETDCVLHLARDYAFYGSTDDITALLGAGHNVITVHPYQHLEFMEHTTAPDGIADRIREACEAGGSTFHASGSHPEWTCSRLTPTIAGLCHDITTVKVEENWDVSFVGGEYLQLLGFGQTTDFAKAVSPVGALLTNYCQQNLHGTAKGLGVTLERYEVEEEVIPAEVDIDLPNIFIAAGTVGRMTHRYKGYVSGREKPFVVIENNWMMGRNEMLPDGVTAEDYYVVAIEGTPSIRVSLDIKPSLESDIRLMDAEDPTSEPGYYGILALLLQAVPSVHAAKAGVLEIHTPPLHWAPDYRDLTPIT